MPRSEIYSLYILLGLLLQLNCLLQFFEFYRKGGFLFADNCHFAVLYQAWVGEKSLLFPGLVADFSGIRISNQGLCILICFVFRVFLLHHIQNWCLFIWISGILYQCGWGLMRSLDVGIWVVSVFVCCEDPVGIFKLGLGFIYRICWGI